MSFIVINIITVVNVYYCRRRRRRKKNSFENVNLTKNKTEIYGKVILFNGLQNNVALYHTNSCISIYDYMGIYAFFFFFFCSTRVLYFLYEE